MVRVRAMRRLGLFLLLLLLALAVACTPRLRRGGGGDDDDDSGAADDDDASTSDDDDAAGDDDDGAPDDDDASGGDDDDAGPPESFPNELVDRAFLIDLANAEFIQPPGIGSIIVSQLGTTQYFIAATDGSDPDEGSMEVIVAIGEGYEQDLEQPTSTVDDGVYSDDAVRFDDADFSLDSAGATVDFVDTSFGVTFDSSHENGYDGWADGLIDTRGMDPLLSDPVEEGVTCSFMLETLGLTCIECGGSNPGEFCLVFELANVSSEWVPGMELVEVN